MVIQRWQTVFLLLATVMMALFSFMSLGQIQLQDYTLNFTTLGFTIEGEATGGAPTGYYLHTASFFIISVLSAVIPFITIFLYKTPARQLTLCLVEILFLVAVTAVGCYLGYYVIEEGSIGWSSIIIAPLLAFIATVMAYNYIKRDIRKLRDTDRIR